MLPQDRHEHEDGGDEDDGQGDLRDGPAGEGLDLALGTFAVFLLVPAREGGKEKEADEGEDNGDDAAGRILVVRTCALTLEGKERMRTHIR